MIRHGVRYGIAAAAALLLTACSGQQVQLDIKARMEGQPAAGATVMVDGKELGVTDGTGMLAKPITRSAGAEVEVLVSKELSGHRIKPWKTTFLIKLGKDGKVVDRYSFEADLAVTRYFTVAVNEGGTPVTDAIVKLNDKELGKTDAKGELVHEYTTLPPKGVTLTVSKSGYAAWQKSASVQAGERLQVALARRAVLTVTASSDEYGVRAGVPGVAVSIDGRPLGKTDDRGNYTYTYDGAPGRKAQVALSAPGYLPADWKTAVVLEGQVSVQRAFAPATPRPIRVGVHRFVGNTPGADLKDVASQAESAIAAQLFKASVFREVPVADLESEVKRLKVGIDRIATRGWQDTPLRRTVDMIVLGSVARDDKGLIIETKFYTAGGSLVWSQIARARDAGAINSAVREVVANVMERFPFEGTVVAVDGERYRLNLGRPYRVGRGTEFALLAADAAKGDSRQARSREVGLGRVRRKQRELRSASDAVGSAEVEPVALAVHRDHRALEGEPLHHVGDDLADGAVDRPRVSCARDLAPDEASAGRVELGLDDEAFVVAGDAAEHDHVDRAAQRRVLPAPGRDPVDADLQPLDLALEVGDRHLAEHGGLEELGRDGGFRLGGDVLEIRAGSVAHEPVHADPDGPGRGRGEGALHTDLALEDDGRFPIGGEVAGRRQRDLRLAARRPVVRIGVVPPIVGLAERPAVNAHRDAGHAGADAVLVAAGGHGQDGPPGQRDLQPLSRLHGRALLPGRIAGLADREGDALRGQRRVFVNELALGVCLAELLVVQLDGGVGDRRPALVHGHGEVAGHGEIRLEGIPVDDLAVLAELHRERCLPGLDAVP